MRSGGRWYDNTLDTKGGFRYYQVLNNRDEKKKKKKKLVYWVSGSTIS